MLTKPLILSITLHVTLLAVLLLGDFSAKPPKPTPSATPVKPIQAVAVDRREIDAQVNKLKKQKADEAKRLKALEEKAAAAKRRRAQEEKRLKALEQQRKKKERERKAAETAAKKAKAKAAAAEKLRKQKEKKAAEKAAAQARAKRKKEQEAAKKAEQLRKKRAEEKRRKAQEAKERAEQQRLLEKQMAEEMASRQRARNQQITSEIGKYTALITRVIQNNLLTDKATMEGKSCKLTIKLAPSGFVISVQTGTGDRVVCDAARNAVNKSGKLPVSKDPEVFEKMRTISLTVVPEF
ncbi:cell envelope integrity protein TolA [Thalassotalea sp. G2M2-11]|uniref:cell envelope integrity protein TolA n=1 Tax=Thalassotalea sp. G2M2-11 TaxID=2787627 RepID=UPI001F49ACD8|nr:cell envelope integrity protein TolA [Thalassotalea sp. G2M2-11]